MARLAAAPSSGGDCDPDAAYDPTRPCVPRVQPAVARGERGHAPGGAPDDHLAPRDRRGRVVYRSAVENVDRTYVNVGGGQFVAGGVRGFGQIERGHARPSRRKRLRVLTAEASGAAGNDGDMTGQIE